MPKLRRQLSNNCLLNFVQCSLDKTKLAESWQNSVNKLLSDLDYRKINITSCTDSYYRVFIRRRKLSENTRCIFKLSYYQKVSFLITFRVIRLTIRSFEACITMLFSTENIVCKKLIFEEKSVKKINSQLRIKSYVTQNLRRNQICSRVLSPFSNHKIKSHD